MDSKLKAVLEKLWLASQGIGQVGMAQTHSIVLRSDLEALVLYTQEQLNLKAKQDAASANTTAGIPKLPPQHESATEPPVPGPVSSNRKKSG